MQFKAEGWQPIPLYLRIIYLVGGIDFLIGSIFLLPSLVQNAYGLDISGWMFTVGCTAFSLADFIPVYEYWNSSEAKSFNSASVTVHLSFVGSFSYLIGSIMFIPEVDQFTIGLWLFVEGSTVIFLFEGYKAVVGFRKYGRSRGNQILKASLTSMFGSLGGLGYLVGSIFFLINDQNMPLAGPNAFILGGCSFLSNTLIVQIPSSRTQQTLIAKQQQEGEI